MRLIDADALILAAQQEGAYGYVDAKEIADAPTIDAVPVVRCKDCKYRKVYEYNYKDIGYRSTECTRGNEGVIGAYGDSGYCSDGERKEEP